MVFSSNYSKVKISPTVSYVYTKHLGSAVKIHRIQNTNNKLGGEYTKRYHPDKLIQTISINEDIQTIAEIELLSFIENKNKHSIDSVLIDVRLKEQYNKETIPSAINIPLSLIEDKHKLDKICILLDINQESAKNIILFDDGVWSNDVNKFIDIFLKSNYPKTKIYYYRGGIQMWKILGLTTVSPNFTTKEKH